MFENISEKHLPFAETIRLFIEYQFNFIAKNPRLPLFVMNEVFSDKEKMNLVLEVVSPKIREILAGLEDLLNQEVEKGAIRPVKLMHLMMNIISMNVSSFLSLPLLETIIPGFDEKAKELILNERRECNVQFILKALQP